MNSSTSQLIYFNLKKHNRDKFSEQTEWDANKEIFLILINPVYLFFFNLRDTCNRIITATSSKGISFGFCFLNFIFKIKFLFLEEFLFFLLQKRKENKRKRFDSFTTKNSKKKTKKRRPLKEGFFSFLEACDDRNRFFGFQISFLILIMIIIII